MERHAVLVGVIVLVYFSYKIFRRKYEWGMFWLGGILLAALGLSFFVGHIAGGLSIVSFTGGFMFSGAGKIIGDKNSSRAIELFGAGLVIFSILLGGSDIFSDAGAGALSGAIIATVLCGFLMPDDIGRDLWVFLSLFVVAYVFLAILWFLPKAQNTDMLLIPVFLGLLPFPMALFDWISLGFTRSLLHAIYRGHHTGSVAIGWALADTLLALFLLAGTATLAAGLLATLNALGDAYAGKTLIDLGALMAGIRENPASVDYGWIHFMMLSTLVPTLVHFTLAGSAAMLAIPDRLRQWVLAGWEKRNDARFVGFLLVTATPVLGLVGPLLLLAGLWQLLTGWHGAVGWALFDWVAWVIGAIDPTFSVGP